MHTYEVFLKKPGKDEFRHAGSLDAPDDEFAQLLGRDTYCRRGEGTEMWLVDRDHLIVVEGTLLDTNRDQSHRHNDGSAVAARRKQVRDEKNAS